MPQECRPVLPPQISRPHQRGRNRPAMQERADLVVQLGKRWRWLRESLDIVAEGFGIHWRLGKVRKKNAPPLFGCNNILSSMTTITEPREKQQAS